MYALPGIGCHELEGDKKGYFAVSIKDPHRIIFKPDHDPVPKKEDGGIDLKQITRVCVISVMDYH
jgi:proteic killer suppression protein